MEKKEEKPVAVRFRASCRSSCRSLWWWSCCCDKIDSKAVGLLAAEFAEIEGSL